MSVRTPTATTNPFIPLLARGLGSEVAITYFSWRFALFARYDLLHVHWPEDLYRAKRRSLRWIKRALSLALLARLRLTGVPLVRTVHNSTPHESGDRLDHWFAMRLDLATDRYVVMTKSQLTRFDREPVTYIPHGHYRDWFADCLSVPIRRIPGRVVFVGLIRPYKQVDRLVEAFSGIPTDHPSSLRIAGAGCGADLARRLLRIAARDTRIELDLTHLSDMDISVAVRESELVVLPYARLENSGALLLALSLGRPVLVPRTPTTEELESEIGADWVMLYDGDLTSVILQDAIARVSARDDADVPDLSTRDWHHIRDSYIDVYAKAAKNEV